MDNATEESIMDIIGKLKNIDYINPEDIPNIELYMDQVTTFMDEHLAACKRLDDDKILTKPTGQEKIFQRAYESSDFYLLF